MMFATCFVIGRALEVRLLLYCQILHVWYTKLCPATLTSCTMGPMGHSSLHPIIAEVRVMQLRQIGKLHFGQHLAPRSSQQAIHGQLSYWLVMIKQLAKQSASVAGHDRY